VCVGVGSGSVGYPTNSISLLVWNGELEVEFELDLDLSLLGKTGT
jgi:hypothetical protein